MNQFIKRGVIGGLIAIVLGLSVIVSPHVASASFISDLLNFISPTATPQITVSLNKNSPAKSMLAVSSTSDTDAIVLAIFDIKSQSASSMLNKFSVTLNTSGLSPASLFSTLTLKVGGQSYSADAYSDRTITFSNMNVLLPADVTIPMAITGKAAALNANGISNATVYFTFVGNNSTVRAVNDLLSPVLVKSDFLYTNEITLVAGATPLITNKSVKMGTPTIIQATNAELIPVEFSFDVNALSNDVFIQDNPSFALSTTTTNFKGKFQLTVGKVTPSVVTGDGYNYFVVKAGSSRTFTYTGTLLGTTADFNTGIFTVGISAIKYGATTTALVSQSITQDLGGLQLRTDGQKVLSGNDTPNGGGNTLSLRISKSSTPVRRIVTSDAQQVVAEFDIHNPTGEIVSAGIRFGYSVTGQPGRRLTDMTIYDKKGEPVLGPVDFPPSDSMNPRVSDVFYIPTGSSHYVVKGVIDNIFSIGQKITFTTNPSKWANVLGTKSLHKYDLSDEVLEIGTDIVSTTTQVSGTPGTIQGGNPSVKNQHALITALSGKRGTQVCNTATTSCTQQFSINYSVTAGNGPIYISTDISKAVTTSMRSTDSTIYQVTGIEIIDVDTAGDTSRYFYIAPGQTKDFTAVYQAVSKKTVGESAVFNIQSFNYGSETSNLSLPFPYSPNVNPLSGKIILDIGLIVEVSRGSTPASVIGTPGNINCPTGTNCAPVTPPTPISGNCYLFSKYLTLGDSSVDVVALQTFLINQGLLVLPAGTVKGTFGEATKNAVLHFQNQSNITEFGDFLVGPYTIAKLNRECVKTSTVSTVDQTASSSVTVLSPNGGEIYRNDANTDSFNESIINIKYTSVHMIGSRLTAYLYSPIYGNTKSVSSIADNSGYMQIILPKGDVTVPGQYKITLCSSVYTGGKDICDSSDRYFTITSTKINPSVSPINSPTTRPALKIEPQITYEGYSYEGTVGQSFSKLLIADASVNWTVGSGTLPPGLHLVKFGAFSGQITGTPTVAGTYNFSVIAQDVDDYGRHTQVNLVIRINAPTAAATISTAPVIIQSTAPSISPVVSTAPASSPASTAASTRGSDITNLYRTLLNREADANGYYYFYNSSMTISQIESTIKNTEEYKNLHTTTTTTTTTTNTTTTTTTTAPVSTTRPSAFSGNHSFAAAVLYSIGDLFDVVFSN